MMEIFAGSRFIRFADDSRLHMYYHYYDDLYIRHPMMISDTNIWSDTSLPSNWVVS